MKDTMETNQQIAKAISMLAHPLTRDEVEKACVIALDKAGNSLLDELLSEVEGKKITLKECGQGEKDWKCNSCESMMSCEVVDQDRRYNQALEDVRAIINHKKLK